MPGGELRASEAMRELSFSVAIEAVPGAGEDCFYGEADEAGLALCVADGCGGSGARRYAAFANRTGASLASELAVDTFRRWLPRCAGRALPRTQAEADAWARGLEKTLRDWFQAFRSRALGGASGAVHGSLMRALPTTFCALLARPVDGDPSAMDALACWAGDSRAYLLSPDGLRQLTRDDVAQPDAMATLRSDPPLRNVVDADAPFALHGRAMRLPSPCALLCASDGAYAYLPTPMEFELLLLSTLQKAKSAHDWGDRLTKALAPLAGDDTTLVLAASGYADFAQLQRELGKRRAELQRRYVTPVRRRKQNVAYATQLWQEYRQHYEWKDVSHGDDLRRV